MNPKDLVFGANMSRVSLFLIQDEIKESWNKMCI